MKYGHPYAKDAKVPRRAQKEYQFLDAFFRVLRETFASSASLSSVFLNRSGRTHG